MKGPPEQVVVGRVLGTHGNSGQVRVQVHSDVPHRFDCGEVLYLDGRPLHIIASVPFRTQQVILRFQDVESVTAARTLVGSWLTAPESEADALPEGDYYHYQLIGLRVLTEDGEELGQLREIIPTGSNDVYLISNGASEILIPAIAQVVREVNLEQGLMVVQLMEGLR